MPEFSTEQGVMLASLTMSVILSIGFIGIWIVGKDDYKHNCFLPAYAGYLMTASFGGILLTVLNVGPHGILRFAIEITAICLIARIAYCWSGIRELMYLLAAIGIVFAVWHNASESLAASYAVIATESVMAAVACYGVYKDSPWWIVIIFTLTSIAWMAYLFSHPHPGDIVGHAWAMVLKVQMFGSVAIAHYERRHRQLFDAAYVRQAAIDITTGQVTDIEQVENGTYERRPARLRGLTAPYRING